MIKITYRHLNQTQIEQAIGRLMNIQMPGKSAYNLAKISQTVAREIDHGRKHYETMMKKYAVIENGKIKIENQKPAIKPELATEYTTEFDAFLDTAFEIQREKLNPEALTSVQLTPNEVIALEPILA